MRVCVCVCARARACHKTKQNKSFPFSAKGCVNFTNIEKASSYVAPLSFSQLDFLTEHDRTFPSDEQYIIITADGSEDQDCPLSKATLSTTERRHQTDELPLRARLGARPEISPESHKFCFDYNNNNR